MNVHVHQFPCLTDNYGVLVHDASTGATAAIDAPDAAPILAALKTKGWTLTDILITHHHADHTQGIAGLKAAYPQAVVTGPAKEADRFGGVDRKVGDGDYVKCGSLEAMVIETPGHTAGHVSYWFEDDDLLFAGDTLFAMGCGRAFEAPPATLYRSVMKLAALPGETQLYCGHEYTLSNARFALTVDPDNSLLQERAKDVAALREAGKPTVPSTITIELATNPFLRAEIAAVQAGVGMAGADPSDVFTELRERKNRA